MIEATVTFTEPEMRALMATAVFLKGEYPDGYRDELYAALVKIKAMFITETRVQNTAEELAEGLASNEGMRPIR